MIPVKTWRVFLNHETRTHVVLNRREEVEGYCMVFGPETFEACMDRVNSKRTVHANDNYWVFRDPTTGVLTVQWGSQTSFFALPVYGPDTCDRCQKWVTEHAHGSQAGQE